MSVSKVLKRKRKELGYTLLDIANKVGVSEATVQRWESGNIKNLRYEKIIALSEVLNVSPSYLMGWENDSCVHINDASFLVEKENFQDRSLSDDLLAKRLLEIFGRLDENSRKELLSYAEFKNQVYESDPDLKDAENIADEYIKECEKEREEEKESAENTPDQPEKIG